MPSILETTMQSALLQGTSNILAQLLKAYKSSVRTHTVASPNAHYPHTHQSKLTFTPIYQSSFTINILPVLQFVLYTLLSTPLNCLFHRALESWFPSSQPQTQPQPPPASKPSAAKPAPPPSAQTPTLNIRNTLLKVLLDQTLSAAINCILFLSLMTLLQGGSLSEARAAVQSRFTLVMLAGYKVWPMVSLANFVFVPAERRVLVGALVGVGWGVFLSLVAAGN